VGPLPVRGQDGSVTRNHAELLELEEPVMKTITRHFRRSIPSAIAAAALAVLITASSARAQCLTPCTGGTPTPVAAIEQPKPPSVPSFTLIELLVVISIIGILVS
jgi:prepilin-type N-terminal cleavage/methylation domain-containing protein